MKSGKSGIEFSPRPTPRREWSYVLYEYNLQNFDHLPGFLSKLIPSDYEVIGRFYHAYLCGNSSLTSNLAKTTWPVLERLSNPENRFLKLRGVAQNRAVILPRGRRAYEIYHWHEYFKEQAASPNPSSQYLAYLDFKVNAVSLDERKARLDQELGLTKRGRPVGAGVVIKTGDPTTDRYWKQIPAGLRLKLFQAGEDALEMYKFYRNFGRDHMLAVYGPAWPTDPITETDMVEAAFARKKALAEKSQG
jgi:hypothetical protein